jgi:predicted phage-related endonuclease
MTIERISIENRDQWLKLRGQDVTASVAGALLGVHPYISMLGLYLSKSGLIEEDQEDTPPLRRGRLLEPVAVQMLREDRPGWTIEQYPVGHYYRDPDSRLGATPDLLVRDEIGRPGVVQLKSVEPSVFRKQWKDEDGSITPPLWIAVQALIETHLTGREWAAVAPLIVGFGAELPVIQIPIHVGIIDRIKAEVRAFWDRVARGDPPPADYAHDGALIARLYPEASGEIIDLSADNHIPAIAAEDKQLAAEIKERIERRDAIKTEVLAKLGAASGALFQGGRITACTVNRKAYSVAASSYRKLTMKLAQEKGFI